MATERSTRAASFVTWYCPTPTTPIGVNLRIALAHGTAVAMEA
jgi:hypothetical protein